MRGPRRLVVNRGETVERFSKSSPCKILDECASCPKLGLEYREQLQHKTDHLKNLLRLAGDDFAKIPVKDCTPSPRSLAYRYTAKLVVGEERRHKTAARWIKIGLYRPFSHDLVDIGSCPVQSDAINKIIAFLRGAIRQFDISVYDEKKKTGLLRFILVRSSEKTNQQLVTFVTHGKGELTQLRTMARELSAKFSSVRGVLQHINESGTNSIFSNVDDERGLENTQVIVGTDNLEDELNGLKLRVSATSFFQTNPAVAELMYARIADLAGLRKGETALDLYCGVGGIALSLAKSGARVIAIDETVSSIKDAVKNAELNGLGNAQFQQGKVEALLPSLATELRPGSLSVVSLNPARGGCEASVLKTVATLKPRSIVYMSCYPESLVRDLKLLVEEGFKVAALEPFDMFPGTNHYEVLAYIVAP